MISSTGPVEPSLLLRVRAGGRRPAHGPGSPCTWPLPVLANPAPAQWISNTIVGPMRWGHWPKAATSFYNTALPLVLGHRRVLIRVILFEGEWLKFRVPRFWNTDKS